MRKMFFLLLTLVMLLVAAVAQAGQVTDAKWGVDKDNVLRLVVDVNESSGYAVSIKDNSLFLTVDAELTAAVPKSRNINSSIANIMYITSAGKSTVLQLPLKKTVTEKDYNVFVLKKDEKNNRPYRVVLDITADKKINSVVVASKPIRTGKTADVKTAAQADKKTTNNTTATTTDKSKKTAEPKSNLRIVKATKAYRTSGGIEGKVITIDAGHGGSDPGAIGAKGTKEKNITLPIATFLKNQLEKRGAIVHMTRTTDKDVARVGAPDAEELQERVNVAQGNNSDLFISVHINSAVNKKVGGIASYYFPKTLYDKKLAQCLQKELSSGFGVDNLGIREANFYVIKRSSMPATLLELCFISNAREETLLNSKWFQTKAAKLIADGVENYFS